MKKIGALFALLILAMGCQELSGTIKGKFEATEDISLISKNFWGVEKNITVQPGSYDASLSFNLNSLALTLNKLPSVKFKVDKESIPQEGGHFVLPSSVSGQPCELEGDLDISATYSSEISETQFCQKQVMVQVCKNGECHYVPHNETGTQWVRYYIKTTILKLDVQLFQDAHYKGDLKAAGKNQQKLYSYQGPCL